MCPLFLEVEIQLVPILAKTAMPVFSVGTCNIPLWCLLTKLFPIAIFVQLQYKLASNRLNYIIIQCTLLYEMPRFFPQHWQDNKLHENCVTAPCINQRYRHNTQLPLGGLTACLPSFPGHSILTLPNGLKDWMRVPNNHNQKVKMIRVIYFNHVFRKNIIRHSPRHAKLADIIEGSN